MYIWDGQYLANSNMSSTRNINTLNKLEVHQRAQERKMPSRDGIEEPQNQQVDTKQNPRTGFNKKSLHP